MLLIVRVKAYKDHGVLVIRELEHVTTKSCCSYQRSYNNIYILYRQYTKFTLNVTPNWNHRHLIHQEVWPHAATSDAASVESGHSCFDTTHALTPAQTIKFCEATV